LLYEDDPSFLIQDSGLITILPKKAKRRDKNHKIDEFLLSLDLNLSAWSESGKVYFYHAGK